MRIDTRQPKHPVTWLPAVFEILKNKGHVTSRDLATVTGRNGGDALTRCRQLGIPVTAVGAVTGNPRPRKLYALDGAILWRALEHAVKQIDQSRLNHGKHKTQKQAFRTVGNWIQYFRRLEKSKSNPGKRKELQDETKDETPEERSHQP